MAAEHVGLFAAIDFVEQRLRKPAARPTVRQHPDIGRGAQRGLRLNRELDRIQRIAQRTGSTRAQKLEAHHVPGMLARSQFVAADGLPLGQFGGYDADDRTPFRRRWGGWYVTGTHGGIRHMGNAIVSNRDNAEASITAATLNRTTLDGLFDGRSYPSALSDIAALMVFQHQGHMMNLITRVGWESRMAAHEQRLDFGTGPLKASIAELVDYALFVNEAPLTDAIRGTSGFAEKFSEQGPFDSRGRSLRQLDLNQRLLRYPCTYMIYSPAFRALPAETRQAIYTRMWELLSARADRRDVIDILRETVPDLPPAFRASQ